MSNILALHRVVRQYYVQYDSRTIRRFIVWRDDRSTQEFTPGSKGLYYHDYGKIKGVVLVMEDDSDINIDTVKEN